MALQHNTVSAHIISRRHAAAAFRAAVHAAISHVFAAARCATRQRYATPCRLSPRRCRRRQQAATYSGTLHYYHFFFLISSLFSSPSPSRRQRRTAGIFQPSCVITDAKAYNAAITGAHEIVSTGDRCTRGTGITNSQHNSAPGRRISATRRTTRCVRR